MHNRLMMLSLLLSLVMTSPRVENDIVYSKPDGIELKMDIYHPEKPIRKPCPAVVVIHGGAWVSGSRQDVTEAAKTVAEKGFVGVNISYRLAPKSKWPAQINDVQTAIRFIRANSEKYGIDKKSIASMGFSAGGHLALLAGFRDTLGPKVTEFPNESSQTQCVIDFFGPTDLSQDYPKPLADMLCNQLLGKPFDPKMPEVRDFSPINFVTKDSPPLFIFQGLADTLVSPNQSRILEAKYKALNLPCKSFYLDKVGHAVPMQTPGVQEAVNSAYEWLVIHLGKARP